MLIALWWTVDAKLIVMICSRVSEGVSDLDHEDEATVSVLQPGTQSLQAAPVPEQRRNINYTMYSRYLSAKQTCKS